ncbi:MAG: TetR/AcrR family transcriptional regulator [Janthinobacterium lividum]
MCEVATELFYRRGIRAVGVDEIVNETGVTKPTLYRSYASKDQLVEVCLRNKMDATIARWDALALSLGNDPLGQMRAILGYFAAEIGDPDYRGCALTNAAVEFPEPGHPARAVSESSKAALRSRLVGLARRLDVADPDALADGLVLLIEGASTVRHTSGSQGPAAALLKTSETLIAAHLAS